MSFWVNFSFFCVITPNLSQWCLSICVSTHHVCFPIFLFPRLRYVSLCVCLVCSLTYSFVHTHSSQYDCLSLLVHFLHLPFLNFFSFRYSLSLCRFPFVKLQVGNFFAQCCMDSHLLDTRRRRRYNPLSTIKQSLRARD